VFVAMVAGLTLLVVSLPVAAQSAPAVNIVEGSPTDINSWAFDTPNLAVSAGDTVTWTNAGSMQHTVTADDASYDSGMLNVGDTFSQEFDTPGTYTYHCTPHPWMKGTITVH
jgi:amicyanin